jgi:hypothetical protein
MSSKIILPAPADAALRRAAKPTIVYPANTMPRPDMAVLESARHTMVKIHEVVVPPRNARAFRVSRGQLFRIVSIEGPQVGDLNLWNADDLSERFFSGKTRALHATHVGTGDRLWSTMPYLRPMVTISHDTLGWYGWDSDGAGIHDVIGTRCDPYTNLLLSGTGYDFCCHSNLSRALAAELKVEPCGGRASYPRRAQCLHVHGVHEGHAPIFHEGKSRPPRRLHRVFRGDQFAWSFVGLSRWRLQCDSFQRCCGMLPAQDRNLRTG